MDNLTDIQEKIARSRTLSSISADKITLLGASKGQNASLIESFIARGVTDFGENRVQEAIDKWLPLKEKHPNVRLHLIGPLQTNKIKQALSIFDVIQTLDRPKLAEELAKHWDRTQKLECFIQVNTGEEPQKAGVAPEEVGNFITYCINDLKLPVTGLMCIPPAELQPAPHFALLRKLAISNGLKELSMGMSEDYEAAIRMGSTCVRIGRALFGERD